MNRQQMLERRNRQAFDVELSGGEKVRCIKLSQRNIEKLNEYGKGGEATGTEGMAYIVVQCQVDEDGCRLWQDGEVDVVRENIPFDDILAIGKEVMQQSGMDIKALEVKEKNSSGASGETAGASTSSVSLTLLGTGT
jgi:hypothetical protein